MIELIIPINKSTGRRHYYRFYAEDERQIWLDEYEYQERKTPHSKWEYIKKYSRLDMRSIWDTSKRMEEKDVPLDDFIKMLVQNKIVSQLQIKKWSER